MNPIETSSLLSALQTAFRQVYDPEFGVSIHDLGLIYAVKVDPAGAVAIDLTLTSMYCPAGEVIMAGVQAAAEAVPGVAGVQVNLVWEPPWTPDRMTPEARAELGGFGPPAI